jgi:acyl-CoA synthetase (AMP-forming)/AMP-acid ligase II
VSLREALTAGEPLNAEVIEQVRTAWNLTIRDGYDQTETTAIVGHSPRTPIKPGSMVRPLIGNRAARSQRKRRCGVLERMEFLPGSAFDVEFGGPYDAVLLTNFLHHFDEATCVGLLRRVRAALAPGGITATLEFVPNEDRVSPVMAAQFSMMMLGTTVKGDAYTLRDLERMHLAAGFARLAPDVIPVGPQTVVVASTE